MSVWLRRARGFIVALAFMLAMSSGIGPALAAEDDSIPPPAGESATTASVETVTTDTFQSTTRDSVPPTLDTLTTLLAEYYAQGSLKKMQYASFIARIQEMQGALNLANVTLAAQIADAFVVDIQAEVNRGMRADLAQTVQDQVRQIADLWK